MVAKSLLSQVGSLICQKWFERGFLEKIKGMEKVREEIKKGRKRRSRGWLEVEV